MRGTHWLEELSDDLKFAFRQLGASPVFTAIVITTLALGIGANSAIFPLVDATLLRPLPFDARERVVMVWERSEASPRGRVSPLNLLDWNERSRTFDLLAGFLPGVGGMVMSGTDGTSETVSRQWVTSGFFEALGVKAIAGRTFLPSDDYPDSTAVVMSEALWRTRFDADPSVVGSQIRFDGTPYTVVGIVPKEFQLTGRSSIWALVPAVPLPELRSVYVLQVVGRLKPDATLDAAASDLNAVAEGLARELPDTNEGRGVVLEPLREALIGSEVRLTSMLFLVAVGFVLLICCANVANLLLARATVRSRELALRSALGAAGTRVLRQLLTESVLLSVLGGFLGMGVGAAILKVAPRVIPEGLLPPALTLSFDARALAFSAAATLLVGALFGLAPAWQASRFSPAQILTASSRTTTVRGGRNRAFLVAGEVATAVILLFGAGLLLRTLQAVENADRGYRAGSVLTMLVDPLAEKYPTTEALLQFYEAVAAEVRAVPGVRGVAWASTLPLGPSTTGRSSFEIAGDPPVEEKDRPTASFQIVSPTYFQTLDLPVREGRGFNDGDVEGAVPVCIVNEAFVRGYLRGRSPIGMRVAVENASFVPTPPVVREIVGVARQVKGRPDETEDLVQIYVPLAQQANDDVYLIVRPESERAETLAPSVRAAIGRIDKEQLVSVRNVMTLEDIVWEATSRHRFRAVLVMTFAALAVVLAMVGVFGILAYTIQQRSRDFGVRRALGATTTDVLRLVLGSALRVIAAGAVIGLALSALLGPLLRTVLFGVEPLDPVTFVSVTIVLALAAAASTAGPAWRAARIDPAVTLRAD
jgi:putative ABC transport system permease protein